MTLSLLPQTVVATAAARLTPANPIVVLWCQRTSHRSAYAEELRTHRGDVPIVPVVLRERLFEHANAVMEDIRTLIDEHRAAILETTRDGRLALLILSHTPLALPQLSSPTILPEWFPVHAGELIHVLIEDLIAVTDGALSDLAVPLMAEYLFHLDGTLLRRLRGMDAIDHGAGTRFLEVVGLPQRTREKFLGVLGSAERVRRSVQNPAQFRPSRSQSSIVGLLWSANDADLDSKTALLASALGIPSHDLPTYHEGLISILSRAARVREPAARLARTLVDTICASAHAITVSHHSDRYGRYPLALLHACSVDITRSLASLEAAIHLLPATLQAPVAAIPITRAVTE